MDDTQQFINPVFIARFVRRKSKQPDIRKDGTVRPNLFLPNFNGDKKTSVAVIDELDRRGICGLGKRAIDPVNKGIFRGWVKLGVAKVESLEISVVVDGKPFSRHANLEDWPADKSKRIQIATELADSCQELHQQTGDVIVNIDTLNPSP